MKPTRAKQNVALASSTKTNALNFPRRDSSVKLLPWLWPFARSFRSQRASTPAPIRVLPRPALGWVGPQNNIALRPFDWNCDADAVCEWQRETYALNFPGFEFTSAFALAFRHDLRRASLDEQHGLFVLDDRPSGGASCGFLWLVLCLNSWTNERYGYVNNLYVASEKRGLHLGDALLEHAETWFKSQRVSKLRLTVTTSNEAACRLYERAGYRTERFEMEKNL